MPQKLKPFYRLAFKNKGTCLESREFMLADGKSVKIRLVPEEHTMFVLGGTPQLGYDVVLYSQFGTDIAQLKLLARQFVEDIGAVKLEHRRPKGADKPLKGDL